MWIRPNSGQHSLYSMVSKHLGSIMWKISLYTSLLCDDIHIISLKILDLSGMFWHPNRYEKRYIPKTAGLEIESQAEAASSTRCASNGKDVHIEGVWSQ